jgi:hypothetical protein
MALVMRLLGNADGSPNPCNGLYLAGFNPEANDGIGALFFTMEPNLAFHFANMAEAFKLYHAVPKCRPVRPDGKPHKPLTGYHWEYLQHMREERVH